MGNETNSTTVAIWFHYVYTIQGSILVISNGLILLTILRHEVLHSKKQYVIVAALAFADFYNSMGYGTAGLYRSWVDPSGWLVDSWYCVTRVHLIFMIVGELLASGMLCCISLDRLVCMYNPLGYFGYSTTYSLWLIAPFFTYAFGFGFCNALGVYFLSDKEKKFPAFCWMPTGLVSPFWRDVHSAGVLTFIYCSVILYVPAIIIFKKRQAKTETTLVTAVTKERKQQDKFMKTIALSTLCNLVFWIIGYHSYFFSLSIINKYPEYVFVWAILDVWKNMNPFINIFLFTFRHKDIKLGMKYLFLGKTLTEAAIKKAEQEALNKNPGHPGVGSPARV